MTLVVVDALGLGRDDGASTVRAMHEDRVVRSRARNSDRAVLELVPALPPGVRNDSSLVAVAQRMFGCAPSRLPLLSAWRPASRTQPARLLSASHSWAAVAFSRLAAAGPPAHLILVDAHDDLAVPRTGRALVATSPTSVAWAVRTGRLGIGSFIDPFLKAGVIASYAHVRPDVVDSPRIELGSLTGRVWLDIDLDWACNALDDRGGGELLDSAEVASRLSALGRLLVDGLTVQPELLCVALSPGFLPSRLWQPALDACVLALRPLWPSLELPYSSRIPTDAERMAEGDSEKRGADSPLAEVAGAGFEPATSGL